MALNSASFFKSVDNEKLNIQHAKKSNSRWLEMICIIYGIVGKVLETYEKIFVEAGEWEGFLY